LKLCYVDETGTDGNSPLVVFVGVIADVARVHRTRLEFEQLFQKLAILPDKGIRELKGSDLYYGKGPWKGVDGGKRHEVVGQLCGWLADRKHHLALAAIDTQKFDASELKGLTKQKVWVSGAMHIVLQVQKAHQRIEKGKGATFLVFDEQKIEGDKLATLLFRPPSWSDDYYGRREKQLALDQITDTVFYARSDHIGLVQVADVFAFVFRRYSEICDYGKKEGYEGERERLTGWANTLGARLLERSNRWPKRTKSEVAKAFAAIAPRSLIDLI